MEKPSKEEADMECKARGDDESVKEEHPHGKPSTLEVGQSEIQDMTDEEAGKLQKEPEMKCKAETSSVFSTKECKEPFANDEDDEKDNNGLQPNFVLVSDLTNRCWSQSLPEIELSRSEEDISAVSQIASMEQSHKIEKNPLLLSPVITCLFGFLKIEDVKNSRLVCREWGSTGKVELANRALILFDNENKRRPMPRPLDFQSCFRDTVSFFNSFKFSGYFTEPSAHWAVEELTKFFEEQQKYIKELTLNFQFSGGRLDKKIDLSSWIGKSPLVQKDAKYMTKLSIERFGRDFTIPSLNLIADIKDLTLSQCTVHLEAGIKICSRKLELSALTFYKDGNKLDRLRINDIVDLDRTKELALLHRFYEPDDVTKLSLDVRGNVNLKSLSLSNIDVINGETSQWVLEHLEIARLPYPFHREMKIKEIYLTHADTVDLYTLQNSIDKLTLVEIGDQTIITCSQPILFENLQHLCIVCCRGLGNDLSFLSHFMNCPRLTELKLYALVAPVQRHMKSLWMPKNVTTLILRNDFYIHWVDDNYLKIQKLVYEGNCIDHKPKRLCQARMQVENFVLHSKGFDVDQNLVDFLEHRNQFRFGNQLYIGELKWGKKQFENSVLSGLVDVKSSFYVFKIGERGRGLSKQEFDEALPKFSSTTF